MFDFLGSKKRKEIKSNQDKKAEKKIEEIMQKSEERRLKREEILNNYFVITPVIKDMKMVFLIKYNPEKRYAPEKLHTDEEGWIIFYQNYDYFETKKEALDFVKKAKKFLNQPVLKFTLEK